MTLEKKLSLLPDYIEWFVGVKIEQEQYNDKVFSLWQQQGIYVLKTNPYPKTVPFDDWLVYMGHKELPEPAKVTMRA